MTDPPPAHDIASVFHERGIPFTRQRRLVWDFFAGADRAATITEAAEALRGEGVGQATVYRTVTLLTELGLLARVQDRRGDICYTAPPIGHSHPLICGVCRRIVRFDGNGDVKELEARLERESGFAIYGHHLEIYGICPQCASARGEEGDNE
jgi:Fur family transcriptional regulator, ferric uptake regulator